MNDKSKGHRNTYVNHLELGKLPPQSIDSESAVLGALLIEPNAYVNVSDIIKAEMFYKDSHQHVYNAISNLFAKNTPIDIITVTKELQRTGKLEESGGAFYITQLCSNVAAASHIETHAAHIHDSYIRRKLINETATLSADAYNESKNIDDVLNSAVGLIDRLLDGSRSKSNILSFGDNINLLVEKIKKIQDNKGELSEGLKPSFKELQDFIREYENGRLIIVAGRPGMGKSAFVLNEALSFANDGKGVLFFSLEMTAQQITKRSLISTGDINQQTIDNSGMPDYYWEKLDNAITKIYNYPLFIDDTPLASFAHIKTQAKIYKQRYDIKCIVVDYLQLMGMDGNLPREQQVSLTSRQLKALAKEIDVPIFLLSQLNRGADSRSADGYKPKLSDLRESGAIEQDADIVLFPYRPEYYYKEDPEIKGKGFIIIEKNRDGKTGEAPVDISEDVSRWGNINNTINFNHGFESEEPNRYFYEKDTPF